jgi:antitoxin (DNA-binding transcriptional repressor) of toxin-antitoxin stability system
VQQRERIVVTRRNIPVAVMIPMSQARDFALAHGEEFIAMRQEAGGSWRRGVARNSEGGDLSR